MKLKHLTLRGFKSFADRTRLDFSTGINVVVGPNGSGKSNILDAIAWVLGTQATRSLRTETMEDVVFAGTESRPPLSRAEVSLTFANDEQLVPLGLAEITITRRLFRDGTSEYELNGAACRLLDIQELLADGGIGRHQHVLVNQGQVGEILTARPEDHRAIIEEAAGVTKHRARRDRSIRRLERTDHDVERLNDILAEKRKAMRPLKRQANAAARYDEVRDEAHQLALWLAGEQLRRIRSRLDQASQERSDKAAAHSEADGELRELLASLEGLRESAGSVGAELERDTTAAARLETTNERLRRIALVARERRRALESRLEGVDERREDLEREHGDLSDALDDAEEVEAAAVAERAEAELRALEDEERSLAEQIQLPTEGVVATLRGDLRSLESAESRDAAEMEQVRSRLAVVTDRIEDDRNAIERCNADIEVADAAVTKLGDAYLAAQRARARTQEAWEADEATVAERRLTLAGAAARAEAFGAALSGLVDEVAVGVAESTEGIVGTIVSRLDVPGEYAAAVDAALGVWRGAFVANDAESLTTAVAGIKGTGLGGLSFVHPVRRDLTQVREIAAKHGVDAIVDILGPRADTDLASWLFADIVVVQGWMAAWQIVGAEPSITAVTPEGDVISAGRMFVAQPDGAGPAALEAAQVAVEEAESGLAEAEEHLYRSRAAFDRDRAAERAALESLESVEAQLAGLTETLARTGRTQTASRDEARRLNDRLEALREVEVARNERIATLRSSVEEFQGEEAERQAAWDALNDRRAAVAAARDRARRRREEATATLASIVERRRLNEQRLRAITSELGQLELLPASDDTVGTLTGIEEAAARTMTLVVRKIELLRERQRELRDRAGAAGRDLESAEKRREMLETARRNTADMVGRLDVELAELRVRDEAVVEGIRRDADADEEAALAAVEPSLSDDIDVQDRLASLRADLKRMGLINPLAAAEYATLAAEVEELDRQLEDLAASRGEIRKVIAALDREMEALFVQAFSEIASFYEENFSLVFPGGSGRLRLTDDDHPLTAGVLVEAQPAGKKVGRLSLLSGGERSLAALAFLFAVFRARPSPFYVLDEVEAALDDANLHRFLTLVDTLRSDVQLVIITHQQQTMHAADVLYGVTMESGATSQVISKRMDAITV
ncbi:MAG: chromosome segregation protein SMC [Acidimicrobiia bacterium]